MHKRAFVRITDWDFVLCEIDRHQIENLVWLGTASFAADVKSVKLEIDQVNDRELGKAYQARCRTELASRKVIETVVIAASKRDLIVGFGKRLRTDIEKRLALEASVIYRFFHLVRRGIRRLGTGDAIQHPWLRNRSQQTS
jgi:hypothetical protein